MDEEHVETDEAPQSRQRRLALLSSMAMFVLVVAPSEAAKGVLGG